MATVEIACFCGRHHFLEKFDTEEECKCGCFLWVKLAYGDMVTPYGRIPTGNKMEVVKNRKNKYVKVIEIHL